MTATEVLEMVDRTPKQGGSSGLRWELVQSVHDPDKCRILPSSPPQFLFRGQCQRYSPCIPSIFRGIDISTKALHELSPLAQSIIILRIAKYVWFCWEISLHPAIQWAEAENIRVDRIALAQHYGLATPFFDFTQSAEVALFFATCRLRDRHWTAVSEGRGIVYRLSLNAVHPMRLQPIGLQPFPRPSEQWAWTLEASLGDDLEKIPLLQHLEFDQTQSVGEEMLTRFNGGVALFPPDPLQRIAARIRDSDQLPSTYLHNVIRDLIDDDLGLPHSSFEKVLDQFLSSELATANDQAQAVFPHSELLEMRCDWEKARTDFFQGVGFRLSRIRIRE